MVREKSVESQGISFQTKSGHPVVVTVSSTKSVRLECSLNVNSGQE